VRAQGERAVAMPTEGVTPGKPDARDFEFTAADFERVRYLIYSQAGIALSDQKQELVYGRLVRRVRVLGYTRFRDYLDALERDEGEEMQEFTNALTTNLTAFFREPHHFAILAQRLSQRASQGRCRIWCAAASTGEEAYSAAISMVEAFASWSPPGEILATDIDTTVLERAALGVYALERVAKLGPERTRRFFQKGVGANYGQVRVRKELRALVKFARLNLLDATWAVPAPLDAVFCRNVFIYFDKRTQRRILERMHSLLRLGGLLFVGHSEGLYHCADLFRPLGKTVYEPIAEDA
jgi:chemotaxis protein methyltransferase CheR